MVVIRMRRAGSKNRPFFRVVVTESASARDGRFIEEIGTYNPMQKDNNVEFKMDRVDYWVGCGAQPSDTVNSLIKKAKKAETAAA